MRNPQRPTNDWYFDADDFILAFTPKVASSSIITALKHELPRKTTVAVRQQLKRKNTPVHLFFRDPVERLISFWWMVNSRGGPGSLLMSFEDFCNYILKKPRHPWDLHWIPQTFWHGIRGELIPNTLHRLDEIGDVWPELFPHIELPHRNPSISGKPGKEIFEELPYPLKRDVLDYYVDDLKVWDKIKD